jgi:hypothetical protein
MTLLPQIRDHLPPLLDIKELATGTSTPNRSMLARRSSRSPHPTAPRALVAPDQGEASVSGLRTVCPHHFSTGKLDGELWQGRTVPSLEGGGNSYVLWPYVRSEAMRWPTSASAEFPALQRAALSFHDNLCTFLAAW